MPDFYVQADDSEGAAEKVALILGVTARKAQKFDVKIKEAE